MCKTEWGMWTQQTLILKLENRVKTDYVQTYRHIKMDFLY